LVDAKSRLAVGREEVLYQSNRTRVVRLARPDGAGTMIRKETLGPGAVQRIRHEAAILERLDGVDGVPRVLDVPAAGSALVLEDTGGTALAGLVTAASPMAPTALVDLALDLARVVAAVHLRGIVHKDISPSNVVIAGAGDHRPVLIDFGLATTSAEELPGFTHENQIAGTLAYLSPEQTGRTGRSVDHRADLYALGATLYEMATGRPPFDGTDLLRLVHDHLARVPTAPVSLNPAVPPVLSQIILRLLEKEPDHRYQSAEGLALDLGRLRDTLDRGEDAAFPLGERDFPLRLAAPSVLVGREAEIDRLRSAYAEAVHDGGRCVLVTGRAGVGKTVLINELRPIVTANDGWFVTGRFDQFRHDMDSDAVVQSMRGLGQLLLAEPESALSRLRPRILAALGHNAGLLAEMLPEFALLLEVVADLPPPDQEAEPRLFQAGLDLLRVVVSPDRPLVMIVDDLQWASSTAIGFVDTLLTDGQVPGLLLVGAYRDEPPRPPIADMVAQWEGHGLIPAALRLDNLPAAELGTLVAEMLRLDPRDARALADALRARTTGNPCDTVELINALRSDGVLVPGPTGWSWDEAGLRSYVGERDVVEIVVGRIDRLPEATRDLLAVMACLANEVDVALLRAATGASETDLEERLAPALEDGLLVVTHTATAPTAVRFRHERVQQASYARLEEPRRVALHRTLAETLATMPAYGPIAAQLYLTVVDALTDPRERRRVAGVFGAAAAAIRVASAATAETYLSTALRMLGAEPGHDPLVTELTVQLHATLYRLGRLAEADGVYATIVERASDPLVLADPTCVQVSALSHRGRTAEAMALGLDLLARLGVAVPDPSELDQTVAAGLDDLYRWVEDGTGDERTPAAVGDPRRAAVAKAINRLVAPASSGDRAVMAWLVMEARRLWAEHGPTAALVAPLCHTSVVTIALCQDYRTGYATLRRVLSVSEARGYEPETSQARYLFAASASHWFEPLEAAVHQAEVAREALVHAGDLQFAGLTTLATISALLDTAPVLEGYAAEVDTGIAFANRTGDEQTAAASVVYRQLVRTLRGETAVPGAFGDVTFDEDAHLSTVEGNEAARAHYHVTRALSAALFADCDGLAVHAELATALLPAIESQYHASRAVLLRALSLAQRVRTCRRDQSGPLLAELDEWVAWLAQRCNDAPENYLHLLRLLEAERAWALDDFRGAAGSFDAAMREATPRRRPWHRALIVERAARFHLGHEMEYTGRHLLVDAVRLYRVWGATAKVDQLERDFPFAYATDVGFDATQSAGHSTGVSTESIDLIGVVRASQALSSVTNVDRLRTRVVEILSEMTGATTVRVLLWDNGPGWFLPPATLGGTVYAVEEAGAAGLLPLSAFRVVQRTGEPLLVHDATRDDRFARDPYLADVDRCSLLVVPVRAHGAARAMLFLENRLAAGAFSASRLDAVILIAGQLAVSLENAMVYASLEHKVAERTEELAAANERLELLTVTDPLTGLANRRRLSETLTIEWHRAQRVGGPVGAFMVDIDHFKLLNDRYGHLVGDACLKMVAAALIDTVRITDLVARYGGEEFAVILPGADAENTYAVAERARKSIESLGVENGDAPTGIVTASIGVAAVEPSTGATPDKLLALADAALYEAKRGGRNQVRVHE
jgi:diguanylate cyclase (GGDEF)-like protein